MTDELNDDLSGEDEVQTDNKVNSDEKSYDPGYVDRLKKEALKWKARAKDNKDSELKYQEAERRLKDAESSASQALRQIEEMKITSERRVINAELKAIAMELGLKKFEYVKLGDISSIKIDDAGDVVGAREMLLRLKESDPDLFKMATTTNTHFAAVNQDMKTTKEKSAKNMSKADYEKAERDYLRSCR